MLCPDPFLDEHDVIRVPIILIITRVFERVLFVSYEVVLEPAQEHDLLLHDLRILRESISCQLFNLICTLTLKVDDLSTRQQHYLGLILEQDTRRFIRQRIAESVLVAVVAPLDHPGQWAVLILWQN